MITEQSGGKLWFESPISSKQVGDEKVDLGTTFYLSIPKGGMKSHEGEKGLVDGAG